MSGLNQQDLRVLTHYARTGNRELYWNYLAQHEGADGYGLLALGVVRNDSMPGAVANQFAANVARSDGVPMDERAWERFGEDLVSRDLALRSRQLQRGRPDLALNLPVDDVQRVHDGAFGHAGIDPNAWTPRQLLEAARRQGGPEAAERVWSNMLDSRGLGLGRMGVTSWDVMYTYNDAQLPATRYLGALTGATALAAGDRARTDPDVIGARDFYYQYDQRRGQWSSVSGGGGFGPHIREVTDPARISELDDARAVRLESQRQRGDFHPEDPNRNRAIARSPFTLADAAEQQDGAVRLASADTQPGTRPATNEVSRHPLFPQALAAVGRRDAEMGRAPDDNTRRIAEYATVIGIRNGYDRISDVAFNAATPTLAAGERFFVMDGDSGNPARARNSMLTRDALSASPETVANDLQTAQQTQQAQARNVAEQPQHAETRQRDALRMG